MTEQKAQTPEKKVDPDVMKMQFFAKFIKDAEAMLEGLDTSEVGIARMNLQQASWWGSMALSSKLMEKVKQQSQKLADELKANKNSEEPKPEETAQPLQESQPPQESQPCGASNCPDGA